jgi:hypothetical protein
MAELAEDEFETFIQRKETAEQTLDIQKIMLSIVDNHKFSISEFWEMPLSLVMQLLGMFELPKKKPISRKMLVERERYWNRTYGTS